MFNIAKGLQKIVLQENVKICRFLLEKGDVIYVSPNTKKLVENALVPFVNKGLISRKQYNNLTPVGKNWFANYLQALSQYDIDPQEYKEQVQGMIEVLETMGALPDAFFGVVKERNGDLKPLVASLEMTDQQLDMLKKFVKPPIAISNDQTPVIYQDKGKELVALSKELMIPVPEEEPGAEEFDGLVDDLYTIIYNLTGDPEYAKELAGQLQSAMSHLGRSSGQSAVEHKVTHPEIEAKLRDAMRSGRGQLGTLSDDAIQNLLNTIPTNLLKPEYVPVAKKLKGESPKLKEFPMEESVKSRFK